MFVPAMAFAWWLLQFPSPSQTVQATAEMQLAPTMQDDTSTSEAASPEPATAPDTTTAEPAEVPASPDGTSGERVKLKLVTPQIVETAKTFLTLPMGDERVVELDGRRYVFVLELHYHPPGFVGGPTGWHKGVTVYEMK